MPDLESVLDAAPCSGMESLEGAVGPSVAFSLHRGVVSPPVEDAVCPDQTEEREIITQEALEGSPTPGGSLSMSPGAPSPTFPGGEELRVRGSPLLVPLVMYLYSRIDHLDELRSLVWI